MRLFVAILLLLPLASAAPQFYAVVPDLPGPGPGDEGFAVWDPDAPNFDWSGYVVTDDQGRFVFPDGPAVTGPVWVVGNATLWARFDGTAPQHVWDDPRLVLSNTGETLRLLDPSGEELDRFTWGPGGDVTMRSPGLVYRQGPDGWVTPRAHRIGESDWDRPIWDVEQLTLYASPDSSHRVLTDLIANARERLHLHVYDLRHPELVDAIVAAKQFHPDLDVAVLADGRVVGQSRDDRAGLHGALARIREAGGDVFLAEGGRYTHHHLKVLVADDAVAIQSENWVPNGVPTDPRLGNRGWGVVVHDREAADWFAAVLAADRSAWDVVPFLGGDPTAAPLRLPSRLGADRMVVPAITVQGAFQVTPLIAPDHTHDPSNDPLLALIEEASTRVWSQQLRVGLDESNALGWRAPDRYSTAIAGAAGHGLDVRVQAATPFGQDDTANTDTLAWLAVHGVATGILDRDGLANLHNKGWIIDDAVVLGSMNAHHASRSANREVSVVLEGPGVADYYAGLFLADWGEPDRQRSPLPMLLGLAALWWLLQRSRA